MRKCSFQETSDSSRQESSDFVWTTQQTFNCLKVNNTNTTKKCEIRSKLTKKILEQCHWRRSFILIVNFERITSLFKVFLLLILNRYLFADYWHIYFIYNILPKIHLQISQQTHDVVSTSMRHLYDVGDVV